ncbi:MAG: biotin--[acetyl-CoA-carboxylase] ligase [Armatimonadetes bacterium]|nr:biotin--[acetyl-CoA-carboxylase] ligase [Armatimonadota bacterium]
MKSPLDGFEIKKFDELESTQQYCLDLIHRGEGESVGASLAAIQTNGQGRLGKTWYSEKGHSLTVSLIFWEYKNHPKPWLVGMGTALAVAGAVHCRISWPNDLQVGKKKVGGILTSLARTPDGDTVPVVGIGLNIGVENFPAELAERASNLESHQVHNAENLLELILAQIEALPEPNNWSDIKSIWAMFDETSGKKFTLATGEDAVGIGVGPEGELICAVEGETRSVLAAEALFG